MGSTRKPLNWQPGFVTEVTYPRFGMFARPPLESKVVECCPETKDYDPQDRYILIPEAEKVTIPITEQSYSVKIKELTDRSRGEEIKKCLPSLPALQQLVIDYDSDYTEDELSHFFHFRMVLEYIDRNREQFEDIFKNDDVNHPIQKIAFVTEQCITFYQNHLEYLAKPESAELAYLFLINLDTILRTVTRLDDRRYGEEYAARVLLITHLCFTLTCHLLTLSDGQIARSIIEYPLYWEQTSQAISHPLKQKLLHGIATLILYSLKYRSIKIEELPDFYPLYYIYFAPILFSNYILCECLVGHPDAYGRESLASYFLEYLFFISNQDIFNNPQQKEIFNSLRSITEEIIGRQNHTHMEHAVTAVKTVMFAVKLQLTLCDENIEELKQEYYQLRKEITLHPKLQKLAATFEYFLVK